MRQKAVKKSILKAAAKKAPEGAEKKTNAKASPSPKKGKKATKADSAETVVPEPSVKSKAAKAKDNQKTEADKVVSKQRKSTGSAVSSSKKAKDDSKETTSGTTTPPKKGVSSTDSSAVSAELQKRVDDL